MHHPVLVEKVVEHLIQDSSGVYLDVTCGFGGHTEAILEKLNSEGRVIAIDQDQDAINFTKNKFVNEDRVTVVKGKFGDLKQTLGLHDSDFQYSGILADLGVSSFQLDNAERGFSFQKEGPLDMRMDQSNGISAQIWINTASENEISQVLWKFGEENFSRKIAKAIINCRINNQIITTKQLSEIVMEAKKSEKTKSRKHLATKTFQAIRIYINQELDQLKQLLDFSFYGLKIGGRLCIISFHSLEDRIVKRFFRNQSRVDPNLLKLPNLPEQDLPKLKIITKRIKSSNEEIEFNPRSRSAILRVVERIR